MRELTEHIPQGDDPKDHLEITVTDDPSHGNACHEYLIEGVHDQAIFQWLIKFQKGPIKEHGVNGVTNEALLAIVLDRLRGFQDGPHACPENNSAIASIRNALDMLHRRTNDRRARGVEGTETL